MSKKKIIKRRYRISREGLRNIMCRHQHIRNVKQETVRKQISSPCARTVSR